MPGIARNPFPSHRFCVLWSGDRSGPRACGSRCVCFYMCCEVWNPECVSFIQEDWGWRLSGQYETDRETSEVGNYMLMRIVCTDECVCTMYFNSFKVPELTTDTSNSTYIQFLVSGRDRKLSHLVSNWESWELCCFNCHNQGGHDANFIKCQCMWRFF